MICMRLFVVAATLPALLSIPAQAHFLFVRILPPAEGGRAAEVYFSELAEAGDSRFMSKIAHTQLWLQSTPGKFEPLKVLKAPDRLRAWLPYTGSVVVCGECRYGVLARPKQTPFLLRYFPKALAGTAEELNRMKSDAILDIVPTFEKEGVELVALKDGKPRPRAEFITVDATLANTTIKAADDGKAFWK